MSEFIFPLLAIAILLLIFSYFGFWGVLLAIL
jgi:hypothetical protein